MKLGSPEGSVIKNYPVCRKCVFNPWVRKIPLRRKWQLTAVFLPGESHKQYEKAKRTQKDELCRSVGAQYAPREEWKNIFRKNEEAEPKQKQHPVVAVTGDGSKV